MASSISSTLSHSIYLPSESISFVHCQLKDGHFPDTVTSLAPIDGEFAFHGEEVSVLPFTPIAYL